MNAAALPADHGSMTLIEHLRELYHAAGETDLIFHSRSRPDFSEALAIEEAIIVAHEARVPLHIVHLSTEKGLEIIHRALLELLRKRGVTAIDAVGTDFDPHVHQAVAYEDAPDKRDGEVIAEFRRGFRLGDRLLRPAMVKVAKA